jgi:biopolymer transport protein ExbD
MTTRVGDWLGMLVVFASLLVGQRIMAANEVYGTEVALGHVCDAAELSRQGDGRPILVRYAPSGESSINGFANPLESDLRRTLKGTMATRQERAIFFSADERLSYGEVAGLISSMKRANEGLDVFLVTRSQASAVDGDLSHDQFPYCAPSGWSPR